VFAGDYRKVVFNYNMGVAVEEAISRFLSI
jgi:hypothetical protein